MMADPMDKFEEQESPADGTDLLWDTLCQGEVDSISNYLDWLRGTLGLPQWKIYLAYNPALTGTTASIEVETLKYTAVVHVCLDWVTRDPAEQAMVLLHEVLHVTHHRVSAIVHDELYDLVPIRYALVCHGLSNRMKNESERMVDALAVALADALDATTVWNEIRREAGAPADDEPAIPLAPTLARPALVAVTSDDPGQK